jgi:hypothetical protein
MPNPKIEELLLIINNLNLLGKVVNFIPLLIKRDKIIFHLVILAIKMNPFQRIIVQIYKIKYKMMIKTF